MNFLVLVIFLLRVTKIKYPRDLTFGFANDTLQSKSSNKIIKTKCKSKAVVSILLSRTMINVSFLPRYRLSQILSRRNFTYGSIHRLDSIPDDVSALVQKYAHHPQRSISLQTLLQTGRGELLNKTYSETVISGEEHHATDLVLMQVANFLHREIPVRLAHRIEDLDQVPYLSEMKSVKQVKQTYIDSFLEFIDMHTIQTPEGEEKFAIRLQQLYEKHAGVLMQMARGAFELRAQHSNKVLDFQDMQETQRFLDRFYMSRIGIRKLFA